MKEFVEELIKKLYENVKSSSCPSESCWEHSNKDCDKCNLKKIMISDVIEIVNQLAEEMGVSKMENTNWIPYATNEELPTNGQKVWLSFTNEYTSFVKSAYWIYDHFEWANGKKVKDFPSAWKPYKTPEPYQKGE